MNSTTIKRSPLGSILGLSTSNWFRPKEIDMDCNALRQVAGRNLVTHMEKPRALDITPVRGE